MIGEFSSVLGKLYDAAFDTNKWKPFLADLTAYLNSDVAHFVANVWQEEIILSVYHGISDTMLDAYVEMAFSDEYDPRPVFAAEHPFKPFHWSMVSGIDEFRSSRLYTELFEPHGCHDQLMVAIPLETNASRATHLGLGVWRDPEKGHYGREACERLGRFVPHMKRVYELQQRLIASQIADNPAVDVLELVPIGIMLCDSLIHVQYANAAARQIVEREDGLSVRHRQIRTGRPELTDQLRDLIGRAVAGAAADPLFAPETLSIERPSGKTPFLVMISPVSPSAQMLGTDLLRQPVAVVYVSDPDMQQETSEELLQRLFGLTAAEAHLLKSLVGGASLKSAARSADIAESTARSYLKQIFAKTGTGGQADLIRLISNSPAWLRHQAAEPILMRQEP